LRKERRKMPGAEDFYMKDEFGMVIDNSEEAFEADPVRKHRIISSFKEDFINHDLRATTHSVDRLPGKIAIKYHIPLPIAKEVANHVITDPRSAYNGYRVCILQQKRRVSG
jgi:hypothetical protein